MFNTGKQGARPEGYVHSRWLPAALCRILDTLSHTQFRISISGVEVMSAIKKKLKILLHCIKQPKRYEVVSDAGDLV
jgi:hypothetical protein